MSFNTHDGFVLLLLIQCKSFNVIMAYHVTKVIKGLFQAFFTNSYLLNIYSFKKAHQLLLLFD